MWELRNRIAEHLLRSEVKGIVVAHGTDTLEESAYLVARSLPSSKPVVFTGAMRSAGGGRRLEEMGVIFGGSRRAQQARIDLMLALGAGMKMNEVRAMFRQSS